MNHLKSFDALRYWLTEHGWLTLHDQTAGIMRDGVVIQHTIIEAISPMGLAWTFTGETNEVHAWKNQLSVEDAL